MPLSPARAQRVAVVTGAAQGLGRAFALALSRRNYRLALIDITSAEPVAMQAGAGAHAYLADLTIPSVVEGTVRQILADMGQVDVLVNNLGGFPRKPFLDMTFEDWRAILALNLDSCFLVSRQVAPEMVERKQGRIINVASGTVFKGNSGLSAYVAAKAGVIGLTRVLARELGGHGITVNCVAPGLTATEGAAIYTEGMSGEQATIQSRALRRRQLPQDVIGAVCFLASAQASFITGQTLVVDGGSVMR